MQPMTSISRKTRLDALEDKRDHCTMCRTKIQNEYEAISSCTVSQMYICKSCVEESIQVFSNKDRFNELKIGVNCDFCVHGPMVAVALRSTRHVSICYECLLLCRTLFDKHQDSHSAKDSELPDFVRILILEYDYRFELGEHSSDFLFHRLNHSKFFRAVTSKKIPMRWKKKFTDEELDKRLTLIETVVNERIKSMED